jgi:hypothetical protein
MRRRRKRRMGRRRRISGSSLTVVSLKRCVAVKTAVAVD